MKINGHKLVFPLLLTGWFSVGYLGYFSLLCFSRDCVQINFTEISFIFYASIINGAVFALYAAISFIIMRKMALSTKEIATLNILALALTFLATFVVKHFHQADCIISQRFYEPGVPAALTLGTVITLIACLAIKKCKEL